VTLTTEQHDALDKLRSSAKVIGRDGLTVVVRYPSGAIYRVLPSGRVKRT
jgi:hypothetical protein